MAERKGISINIGLNEVDPGSYNSWPGRLNVAESDARAMFAIAQRRHFRSRLFLSRDATLPNITYAIRGAATDLDPGDILLLTYAGHGSQARDRDGDELDDLDETWLLYDDPLSDDRLHSMWADFREGVRIFVLSDSCHSGTVIKLAEYESLLSRKSEYRSFLERMLAEGEDLSDEALRAEAFSSSQSDDDPIRVRTPPYEVRVKLETQARYERIRKGPRGDDDGSIRASVILISACMDNQLAYEDRRSGHGKFTSKLLTVWDNGAFTGNYREFHARIKSLCPSIQTPCFDTTGVPNPDFEMQTPFTI